MAWNIDSVVCGDGSVGAYGKRLDSGKFYASASRFAGHEGYWGIDIDTLELFDRSGGETRWRTWKLGQPGSPKTADVSVTKFVEPGGVKQAYEFLKDWLKSHPGVAVAVGGPGARKSVPRRTERRDLDPVAMRDSGGNCVLASIVNGVRQLLGAEEATRVKSQVATLRPHFHSLRQAKRFVHGLGVQIECRAFPADEKVEFDKNRMLWVASTRRGVWLVRLLQRGVVDHCVVVDGTRQLIFDSQERYPLELSEESLRTCGGDEAARLAVAEVTEMVEQKKTVGRKRRR